MLWVPSGVEGRALRYLLAPCDDGLFGIASLGSAYLFLGNPRECALAGLCAAYAPGALARLPSAQGDALAARAHALRTCFPDLVPMLGALHRSKLPCRDRPSNDALKVAARMCDELSAWLTARGA